MRLRGATCRPVQPDLPFIELGKNNILALNGVKTSTSFLLGLPDLLHQFW